MPATGRATDVDGLFADAFAREQKTATGLPGGIAIPHCRSTAVTEPTLALARLSPPVDFGAKDGPADLIFLIAAPDGADHEHLKLLSKLARSLVKKDFTACAAQAATPARSRRARGRRPGGQAGRCPRRGGGAAGAAAAAAAAAAGAGARSRAAKRLVAVTACPTGIAHTYMAADSLVAAAKEAGVDLQVETQGSSGATPLDPAVIAAADAVIFAVDVGVRGQGALRRQAASSRSGVKRGIDEPDKMVAEALRGRRRPERRAACRTSAPRSTADAAAAEARRAPGHRSRRRSC